MRIVGSALAALIVVASLAACSSAPTTAPSTAPTAAGSPAADAAPAEFADLSVYYPVAVGNTWVYSIDYGTGPVVTDTEVMSAVEPVANGASATIDRTFHWEDGSQPDLTDSVEYVFHDDGSLTLPFQSIPTGAGVVTVESGTIQWPSTAEFEAGTPKTGTIEASVDTGGTVTAEVIAFTVQGSGTESVSVPAGTYTARKLLQNLLISLPDLGVTDIPVDTVTWLAEDVGAVRAEVPDSAGGDSIVQQLVSFTPGG